MPAELTPGDYVQLGWKLFPCHSIVEGCCSCEKGPACDSPGKHPRTSNGVKAATDNLDQLRDWWAQFPGCNWGVATGQSSGIVVIDIDAGKGGFESWDAYLARRYAPGDFAATLTANTGGGGRHLFLRAPSHAVKNRVNWRQGIDVRGDGGYVIVAPGTHISGGRYDWANWGSPIMGAPEDWLASITDPSPSIATADSRASLIDPIPEGARDDTLFRMACSLRRKHNDDRRLVELIVLEAARASGFPEKDALRKVEQAFQQDHSDSVPRLFVGESPRLNLRGASEIRDMPRPPYLIDGVLPERALFQVFGQTGSYKSFVLLDMLASVANGLDWMGRKVSAPGPVAFVLGEGGYDAGVRVDAWMLAHPNASDERIAYSIEEQLDLMDPDAVDAIVDDLEAWRLATFPDEAWRLIVFDTQADHMPNGDEDKSRDFTVVKRAIQQIAHATGAAVGLVHHTGWDVKRERGSSRQRQALDVVMQVEAQQIKNVKQKAGPLFAPIPFGPEPWGDSIVVRQITPLAAAGDSLEDELEAGRPVLAYLADNPRASQNEIQRDLRIGRGTWPGLRDLLAQVGYLGVTRDPAGRVRSVRGTERGFAWYGIDVTGAE